MSSSITTASAALLLFAACSTSAQPSRAPAAPSDVVATVGPTAITLEELDARALQEAASSFGNLTLAQAVYEARRQMLDEIIGTRLIEGEAAAQGIEVSALVDQEIGAKVVLPTEADVEAWYKANAARLQGAPLEQIRGPIRELLANERHREARRRYVEALKAKTPVRVTLDPPRTKVADGGRPARGPADAPVEIVEFSDFQCPFCQRAFATVTKVLDTYGDRVRFVYRHYPLPNHPDARPAAEASLCAAEQDRFWPYHDRLFANTSALGDADLKAHAAALGLDTAQFNACVDSRKYRDEVQADFEDGEAAGVSGTPAFFINGRLLSGAQPFEAFQRVIDEELERSR
jgi:protein-disulfide isomerase